MFGSEQLSDKRKWFKLTFLLFPDFRLLFFRLRPQSKVHISDSTAVLLPRPVSSCTVFVLAPGLGCLARATAPALVTGEASQLPWGPQSPLADPLWPSSVLLWPLRLAGALVHWQVGRMTGEGVCAAQSL